MRLVVLLALAGCGPPCGSWDDIAISDEIGSPDVAELVRSELSDMERWTGRDEVCVAEVRLQREVRVRGEPVAGVYRDQRGQIALADPWPVHHEVCHALDDGLSDDFPEAEGVSEKLYPTVAARKGEAFATLCGRGPPVPGFSLPYRAACDDLSDAQQMLLDDVYQGDVPEVTGGPATWSYALGQGVAVALEPDESFWGAVAAPGGLLALTLRDNAVELVRIELSTGATTRLLPGRRAPGWFVFPTDGPVVVLPVGASAAWVLDSQETVAVDGYVGPGIVAAGRLWYGDADGGLSSVDLGSGEPVPTGYPYGQPVYRAVHDGQALVFALFDGTLARLDGGEWSRSPGPRFPFAELVPYGDDALVTYASEDESPLVRIATDGTWSIPACESDTDAIFGLWTVDGTLWTVVSAGDGAVGLGTIRVRE